ncbi:DUF7373 family lipoprotein [Nocardia pseudovaccinii]|uniref:DUF7373 family lipoprotein n=1 Tax=Nocardia pseudovaccinii TaxID=189540 RepID=UPI0007A4C9CB|nr:hypothetical protein [Nocardia pseudovaccinii]
MKLAVKSAPVRATWTLLAVGVLALGAVGCGTEVPGTATRVQTDVSKLDVGNYQTKPRTIGNAKSDKQARAREAQRLADYVALPYEADPSYIEDVWSIRSHIVLNRKTLGNLVINDTFDEVAKDLTAGWVNAWSTGGAPEDKRRTLNVAVLMFPDAQTATTVGPMLEHDDFTYNRDNQPVPITKHANTTAHWRPDISSIGSWTVHDRYVIFIKVVDDTSAPDLPALTSQVERMLDMQVPLLDKFHPTPANELSHIPLDPPGLLGRTIPSNPEQPLRGEPDGLYEGRGMLTLLNSKPTTMGTLEKGEVDLVSFGDAAVFRSKTAKGAEALWQEWQPSKNLAANKKMVEAPSGLGENTECYADLVGSGDKQTVSMNICVFQVDRYTVQAFGKQLQDLHQKVSAQYALLTSV